jgi:hypothetical protein
VANAGKGKVNVYEGKTYALRNSIELGEESEPTTFVGMKLQSEFLSVGDIGMVDAANRSAHRKRPYGQRWALGIVPVGKKGGRIFLNMPDDDSVVNVIIGKPVR